MKVILTRESQHSTVREFDSIEDALAEGARCNRFEIRSNYGNVRHYLACLFDLPTDCVIVKYGDSE